MKRRIAIVLAAVMAVAMVGTAMAGTVTDTANVQAATTELNFSVTAGYEWTIPAETALEKGVNTLEGGVTVSNCLLKSNETLTIAVTSDNAKDNKWYLTDGGNGKIEYTLMSGETSLNPENSVLTVKAGNTSGGTASLTVSIADDAIQFAGDFTDKLSFTASVSEVSVSE